MFHPKASLEIINQMNKNTLVEHLDIQITELGSDYIIGKMPVDHRTHQPLGMLHGGASVVLAETLGSLSAALTLNLEKQYCVGLDINANHIKSVKSGFVYGKTTAIHVGKKTQVWEIRITNETNELICISRITMAVLDKKQE